MAVAQKVIDANDIRNGDAVVSVDKEGNIIKLEKAESDGAISDTTDDRYHGE